MTLRKSQPPRGFRNNNPLNIRIGNTWLGEVKKPTDSEFEQFVAMVYGLRAAFVILRRYIKRYHHDTIASIVSTWAPATENKTAEYIESVSKRMHISPDDTILYEDKDTMCNLVYAMAIHENGEPVPMATICKAYDLA